MPFDLTEFHGPSSLQHIYLYVLEKGIFCNLLSYFLFHGIRPVQYSGLFSKAAKNDFIWRTMKVPLLTGKENWANQTWFVSKKNENEYKGASYCV